MCTRQYDFRQQLPSENRAVACSTDRTGSTRRQYAYRQRRPKEKMSTGGRGRRWAVCRG